MGKKEKKERNFFLNLIGIFLVFVGSLAIILSISRGAFYQILWFCYLGNIFIGAGILFRKSNFILAQINILLIPSLFWVFDFFYIVLTGNTIGIAGYFFDQGMNAVSRFVSLMHIYTIPLALISAYLVRLRRKDAWKLSFIEVILLFVLSRIFVSPENNINWVFHSNLLIKTPEFYFLWWFSAVFLMILISNFVLIKLFYKKI